MQRRLLSLVSFGLLCLSARAQPTISEFYVGTPPHQMYVQKWTNGTKPTASPILMIHGGAHTGTTWTMQLDNSPGWASRFVDADHSVYVIDWPGVGRSGFSPQAMNIGPDAIVQTLEELLAQTGPAILMGHSIGGALAFKLAERKPESVRAIIALAPASVEIRNSAVPSAEPDKLVMPLREAALQRFANSALFPKGEFDNYFRSLGPITPRMRNAAVGLTDEFKLDRSRLNIWKTIPVLFLVAEDDRTVPNNLSAETAKVMGVQQTFLGKDWNLPGHAHLYPLETGNAAISKRIQDWIAANVR